jgi:hypothetical protein
MIKPSQINMYPRISDWCIVDREQYNERTNWDNYDIEVVYYQADGEYDSGNSKHRILGAYSKAEITDKLNGNFWEDAFIGETAEQDTRRWVNDIVSSIRYGKDK